jgi:N-acetylmuramoyl-L-alanine amidase
MSYWTNQRNGRTGMILHADALLWSRKRLAPRLLCAVLCLFGALGLMLAQSESKHITFYTAQTTYTLPVLERNGVEYVGLLETLEPLGAVNAKPEGKARWKLKFRDIDSQFETGKTEARIHGSSFTLSAPFSIENSRGYVPVSSLKTLLPAFVSAAVNVHVDSLRVFIGVNPVTFTVRRVDTGKVVFAFSSPVNPQVATEPGTLRMAFRREPLMGDTQPVSFDDQVVTRALYSEANGEAEVTVSASTPLQASFSDDRKTITVSAVMPPVTPPQQAVSQPALPAQPPVAAPARPRPFVLIDAAHGGDDRGAAITDKISEKDVALSLARRLKHELDIRGIQSTLLRDSDSTLTLDQRVAAANSSGTSLYLAIHATTSGAGIRLYTSMVQPQPRKTLAFLRADTAQSGTVKDSRAMASAITTELLKRDTPVVFMAAAVSPLDSIIEPAIAIEIAPQPSHSGDQLVSPAYQQLTVVALANAIAAARSRIPQLEASE